MTQVFAEDGALIPVTVVLAGPCTVVDVRTRERHGYEAIQLGFGHRREKCISKAVRGHMAKAGRSDFAVLAEVRVPDSSQYQIGQEIKVGEVFSPGDVIDVTGTSKGKGFAGAMKRHGFGGHRATHGTHESFRGPGSIGACSFPGRVFKGKRMAGRMGARRTTIQNLRVVAVRPEDNVLLVKGAVPGPRGGRLLIRPAVKASRR
ncbi:MAG: 50S ribosomal protein L3 [Candidatus Dadabacteria bacterium]|nr:MAG: 50S ribosomal protein L3 [Candidatus Dadabacteria bacterium]